LRLDQPIQRRVDGFLGARIPGDWLDDWGAVCEFFGELGNWP
jgi:hypothetical protein